MSEKNMMFYELIQTNILKYNSHLCRMITVQSKHLNEMPYRLPMEVQLGTALLGDNAVQFV